MAHEFITVERKDHLTIITLNRPERMNALHPPAHQELHATLNEYATDPDQWVCIITGSGEKAFSAGNDLKWQAENGREAINEGMKGVTSGFAGLVRRHDCFKPIIAAVNGFALGGGFEIALACDIIIAAENATFGLPEPRVGLMAAAGGVHRLPRQIPYHIAMGMMLAGKRLSAQEAFQRGLANEVVPQDKLLETAEAWAAEIMLGAPLSLQATKEAATLGLGIPLEDAIDKRYPVMEQMYGSEDLVEGPKAFSEKRAPVWKGR
jgi:enoyl-CoA hydratase/carnithine racemase